MVVFYSNIPRYFRSTLVGYLYEITQVYPTILLAEKLDPETENILMDKKFFPKLKEIIRVNQHTGKKMNIFSKHNYCLNLARDVVQKYNPSIVIATGNSFLESYLRRFSKYRKAVNVFFVRFLDGRSSKQLVREYFLRLSYLKLPSFLPQGLRIFLVRTKLRLEHFVYYWIFPLLAGQKPFWGQPSSLYVMDNRRFMGVDYFVVFSDKIRQVLEKDGVPSYKICVLPHPLARPGRVRKFFEKTYFSKTTKKREKKKIALILPRSEPLIFRRDNYRLISGAALKENDKAIVGLIAWFLPKWTIFIKPHSKVENITKIRQDFEGLSPNIKVAEPSDPLDSYVQKSQAIFGLHPSSTALFYNFLQAPEKPIIVIDFLKELGGSAYENFDGIEYVDNKNKLAKILALIGRGKYRKKKTAAGRFKNEREFSGAVEMLNYFLKKHGFSHSH